MACRAHSSFEYYGQQMEAGEIAAVGRLERHRLSNRTVMARQTADGRRQTADGRRHNWRGRSRRIRSDEELRLEQRVEQSLAGGARLRYSVQAE
ncbi:hypothetical protein HBH56_237330 [Parastagonospora nodorum]|nr:hypothetical protein HBH56_237330 [Parastagonospora nodorum]KAH3924369.1 hypothetical protein HBH54_197550 [Parastagonospora nodorum]KAH4101147.1 hypothetical protein HBH46_142670 [Parastagonospora nodorum]KAH4131969.1 hypothetical protein HBH45_185650 [Parastagonospora nodorum]KAH4149898.1 hypothetical protein HBH44_186350 [Parastagonospora nodorum]